MGSIQEKGRALNISNLKRVYNNLLGFGPRYNPANRNLLPQAVLSLYTRAKAELSAYNAIEGPFKTITNNRKVSFSPVAKLLTRSLSALRAADMPKAAKAEALKDATTLIRKYRGTRADGAGVDLTQPATPGAPVVDPADRNSVAHLSFVQRANTLEQLVSFYRSVPAYSPAEAGISIDQLTALHQLLDEQNTLAGESLVSLQLARNTLTQTLDTDDTGLVDIALQVKQAIISAFGFNSPEHKQVSGINFERERE